MVETERLTMNSQLAGILQISIPVADVARATAFYRDVLELKFLFAAPNMAFFDCGGVRLYLSGEGSGRARMGAFVYFKTPDLDRQFAIFKERKVTIHQEPHVIAKMPDHDLWLMWIKDSEGNLLGIMEERKG
jgi:catechol 2,3-dioxygenase-like lactoylglutathione lyase family enzyme